MSPREGVALLHERAGASRQHAYESCCQGWQSLGRRLIGVDRHNSREAGEAAPVFSCVVV